MAVIGDVETKHHLQAVRPKILVMAMAQLDGFGILIVISTFEGNRGRIVMELVNFQMVGFEGIGRQLCHQFVSVAAIQTVQTSAQAVIVELCGRKWFFADAVEIIRRLFGNFINRKFYKEDGGN